MKEKVGAPACVGLVPPIDVVVQPGNTGLDPSQTSFFSHEEGEGDDYEAQKMAVEVQGFLWFVFRNEATSTHQISCARTFSCGSLDFMFPFFNTSMPSRCGLFKLNCTNPQISEIQLEKNGKWYEVTSVSQADTITITDPRLNQSLETGSCTDLSRFSLPDSPWLDLTTLYKCNKSRQNGFTYANCKGGGSSLYYSDLTDISGCSAIKTPESWNISRNKKQSNLSATFSLHISLPPEACLQSIGKGICLRPHFKWMYLGPLNKKLYLVNSVRFSYLI